MRVLSLILFLVAAAVAKPVDNDPPKFYNLEDAPKLFEQFIKDNNREYKDEADRKVHYDAFVNTLKYVNEENAKGHSYTLGITLFADLTEDERKERFGHGCLLPEHEGQYNFPLDNIW